MAAVNLTEAVDQAVADFDEIKGEIEANGVEVGTAPTRDYAEKINEIPVFIAPRAVVDGIASEEMHADNLVTIGESSLKSANMIGTSDFTFEASWGGYRINKVLNNNDCIIGYNPYSDKNESGYKRLISLLCEGNPNDIESYILDNNKYAIEESYTYNPSSVSLTYSIENDLYAYGKIYNDNTIWKLDTTDNVFKKIGKYYYDNSNNTILTMIKENINIDYNLDLDLTNTTITLVEAYSLIDNINYSTNNEDYTITYIKFNLYKITETKTNEDGNSVTNTYYTYYLYKYDNTAQDTKNVSGVLNLELLWHMPTLLTTTQDTYAKLKLYANPSKNKIMIQPNTTTSSSWFSNDVINYLNYLDISDLTNITLNKFPKSISSNTSLTPFWINDEVFTYNWYRKITAGKNSLSCLKINETDIENTETFTITLSIEYNETKKIDKPEGSYVYNWIRTGNHLIYTDPLSLFIINTDTLKGYIAYFKSSIYYGSQSYGYLLIFRFIDDYNFLLFAEQYDKGTSYNIKKTYLKNLKGVSLVKDLSTCKHIGTVNENALQGDSVTVRVWTDINSEEIPEENVEN